MCVNVVCYFIFNGLGDILSVIIMFKGNVWKVILCVIENFIFYKVMVVFCLFY